MSCIKEKKGFVAVLHAACDVWDIKLVEDLLGMDVMINAQILGTVLVHAVINQNEELVRRLVDCGADLEVHCHHSRVDKTLERHGPPLREALDRRNSDIIHMLLQANVNPNSDAYYLHRGRSTMNLAISWGDRSIIKALLFAGASLYGNKDIDLPLNHAVKQNDQELVQVLLDAGVDINKHENRPHRGTPTALATAVGNGNISMARYLFSRGADPHDSHALRQSVSSSLEMLKLLLDEHARRYPLGRKGFGKLAFPYAVELGREDIVSMMLQKNVDTDLDPQLSTSSNYYKQSAFGRAIIKNQPQRTRLIKAFLHAGCDANGIVSNNKSNRSIGSIVLSIRTKITALLAAVGTREVSIVELLIQNGANVNFPASGPINRTPLQRAGEIGSMAIVKLLLEHGAEVNAPPARDGGGTALQLAAIGGYIAIACELMAKGANVDAKASAVNGRTALEGASEHGRLDMVAVLLKAGAAENGKDHKQLKRAIEFARENGHFHVCEFIEDVAGQALVEESELVDWDGQAVMMSET